MKRNPAENTDFLKAIQKEELVYLFGAGISLALTDNKSCGWRKWLENGTFYMKNLFEAQALRDSLDSDSSSGNLVRAAGKLLKETRADGTYHDWMKASFETTSVTNFSLAAILRQLLIPQDVFVTTNYDLLLERATGLTTLTYEDPDKAFRMLDRKKSESVIHIHGVYDSAHGLDNIVADKEQYAAVLSDKGAQFIQQVLGTRTLIFVGCCQTADDDNISQFLEFAKKYLKMDRTYYFLHRNGEVPESLPDNVVLIPYGDAYEDLQPFLEEMAWERLKSLMEKNPLIGRTAYSPKNGRIDKFQKYHYSQESIPFCGRQKELDQLRSFVNADIDFCWWAVTGQAGSGKSRLAFEMLKMLPVPWFGFFINDDIAIKDIDNFCPFSDTVIILDYVSGREVFVAGLLKKLQEKYEAVSFRLRILLIERENNRKTGSWYARLVQRFGKYDNIAAGEYCTEFLNLEDLDDNSVIKLIDEVCLSEGLKSDPDRDLALMNAYRDKHENLRFRPLFIQLFVEAWIANDFSFPRYDSFEEILKLVLAKEQEKWLAVLDNDQKVCNAFIHLLLRSNIESLRTDNIPEFYQQDWEIVSNYISEHSFPGRQREEESVSIINAVCHNIDSEHYRIAPLFPDIIKEFMFFYYMETERLSAVMKEIWENAAHSFSVFIARCMTDFPENEFYRKALNDYSRSTRDAKILAGRLELLRQKKLGINDDPAVLYEIIENEHEFWKSIAVDETDEDYEILSILKVSGLNYVAKAYGGWALYDVSDMLEAIDESLRVPGTKATDLMKQFFLQAHIADLSKAFFVEEAAYLREKLNVLIADGPEESEWDNMIRMENMNAEMMEKILTGDFQGAYKILQNMEKRCSKKDEDSVRILAHSCYNLEHLAFALGAPAYVGKGYDIARKLELLYMDSPVIRARTLGCQAVVLQKEFFGNEISRDIFAKRLNDLEGKLYTMQFGADPMLNEALEMTWGQLKMLKLNLIGEDAAELQKLISEADAVLKENPELESVAATRITATRVLHKNVLKDKVSHGEIEALFKIVELNNTSAVLRNAFFEMLSDSEDADKRENYMTERVVFGARQDARYNPLMGSGIPEIDEEADLLLQLTAGVETEPYIRFHKKIGANDPCPCGSGRKFKKCCRGNGKYD